MSKQLRVVYGITKISNLVRRRAAKRSETE